MSAEQLSAEQQVVPPLVVHVIPTLGSGGAEGLLVTNLEQFDRSRFRHLVVVLCAERSGLFRGTHFWGGQLAAAGVEVLYRGLETKRDLVLDVVPFARWLRSRGAAVVHTHLMFANVLGSTSGRLARVPVVRTLHSVSYEPDVLAGYTNPRSPKHEMARRVESLSARLGCDEIIAVSETVARSARHRLAIPAPRLRVIYNPVRARPPSPDARARLRAELGLAEDAPLVVSVGRVIPSKQHAMLVRAMTKVRQAVPDAHLAIVGGTEHAEAVSAVRAAAAEANLEGAVSLVGLRRDVRDWLAAADVFAFPSRFEGLPVALAESAVAGCACVASDIGSNREVIAAPGMGLLCGVDDVDGFADAIARLLRDPELRRMSGDRLRTFAVARFDAGRAARASEAIYAGLIERRRTRR